MFFFPPVLYRFKLKMDGIYTGQPYYQPLWSMAVVSQERQRLQLLPPHCVIEEYIAVKARFEDERSATMKYVHDLQRDKMIQVRIQATTCAQLGCVKNSGN